MTKRISYQIDTNLSVNADVSFISSREFSPKKQESEEGFPPSIFRFNKKQVLIVKISFFFTVTLENG